jgi:hypothetical protein
MTHKISQKIVDVDHSVSEVMQIHINLLRVKCLPFLVFVFISDDRLYTVKRKYPSNIKIFPRECYLFYNIGYKRCMRIKDMAVGVVTRLGTWQTWTNISIPGRTGDFSAPTVQTSYGTHHSLLFNGNRGVLS